MQKRFASAVGSIGLLFCCNTSYAAEPTPTVTDQQSNNTAKQTENNDAAVKLKTINVEAHAREYKAESASSAIGYDTEIINVPLSVEVISQDILKDQQVNNVDDALRNVSGVTKLKTGNGREEKFSIRGFDTSQSIYKDGVRRNNSRNAVNIPSTETANIDRIEVLKGPASILYGQGEAGGIINYITKKPSFDKYQSFEFIQGSDEYNKFELDSTGGFDQSENLAYRMVFSYEDSDSFRDFTERNRMLFNPSVRYDFNENTRLNVSLERIDDEYTQDRGQVLSGNLINGYSYAGIDPSMFFGIPQWNENTNTESTEMTTRLEHNVSDNHKMDVMLAYVETDKVNFDSTPTSLVLPNNQVVGDDGTVYIQPRMNIGTGKSHYAKFDNLFEFGNDIQHQILVSTSYEKIHSDYESLRSGSTNLVTYNINTRQYSTSGPQVTLDDDRGQTIIRSKEIGINIQDLINFYDKHYVLVGARYSDYEQDGFRERGSVSTSFSDDTVTPRLGYVYKLNDDMSFYVNYAEGYLPSTGALDSSGSLLDPETTTQYELGTKFSLLNEELFLTVALYQIEYDDIIIADPVDTSSSINGGNTESKGIDVQLTGNITDELRIVAGYAYIDNELVEVTSTLSEQKGNRLAGIPEHSANVWAVYEFQGGSYDGLGIGAGVFYQDEVFASSANSLTYDAWTQYDLLAYYKTGQWKFQLNVNNVTDEDYLLTQGTSTSDPESAVRVDVAAPRSYFLSASYEFK